MNCLKWIEKWFYSPSKLKENLNNEKWNEERFDSFTSVNVGQCCWQQCSLDCDYVDVSRQVVSTFFNVVNVVITWHTTQTGWWCCQNTLTQFFTITVGLAYGLVRLCVSFFGMPITNTRTYTRTCTGTRVYCIVALLCRNECRFEMFYSTDSSLSLSLCVRACSLILWVCVLKCILKIGWHSSTGAI